MTCEEVTAQLDAYRSDDLPDVIHDAVGYHLEDCATCAAALSDLNQLANQAPKLRMQAPAGVVDRVVAAIGERYGEVETHFGKAWVGFNDEGISMVSLRPEDAEAFERIFERRLGRYPHPAKVPARYARAVQRAAQGQDASNVPVSFTGLSPFEQEVLHCLRQIPRGEVRPYAWLAKEAGRPRAIRAVGTIMARNPVPLLLPCHRVVPSTGGIGNYGYGSPMKRELLQREGVSVDNLDAWSRHKVRYIGSRTTGIYCYPTCRDARRISWENQVSFSNTEKAHEAGYRPCLHCRPVA